MMGTMKTSMETFNPNMKPTMNTWATFVPGRSTKKEFSTHRTLGHCKNAIKNRTGIIYEYVDGEWVERFRIEKEDLTNKVCSICGEGDRRAYHDTREDGYSKYVPGHYPRFNWVPGELAIDFYDYQCKRDK